MSDTPWDAAGTAEPEIEIVAGREPPPHTRVQEWVTLADISPTAIAAYATLKMHVNRQRGDNVVWPSTLALAMIMGFSRGDKVSPYLKELVAIKAIDILDSNTMPKRNIYVVHSMPPPGYEGPLTLKDWYARNRAKIDEVHAAEKLKRDQRRGRRPKKQQAGPVTPDPGQQENTPPVTPDSGRHVTPDSGRPTPPFGGGNQREGNLEEKNPPPPTPTEIATPPAATTKEGEGKNSSHSPGAGRSLIDQAVDWVTERLPPPVARHPRFSRTVIAEVLGAAVAQERGSLRESAIALLLIADGKYGPITTESSARRLLVPGGQWWVDARAAAATKKAAAVEDQEPCPKPAHVGGFVGNCKQCKGEANGRCPKQGHTGAEIACPQCAAEAAGDGVEGAEGTGTLERAHRTAQRVLVGA